MDGLGGINLGTAYAVIKVQTQGVSEGVNTVKSQLNSLSTSVGQTVTDIGNQVSSIGGHLTTLTAPLAVGGGWGLKVAADFDTVFNEISARTGITGDELDGLKEKALQWGADTVFSGQQVGDAFLQLLTTGMDVPEAIAVMPEVLNAAAAGGMDLGRAADAVTDIMAQFRLKTKKLTPELEAVGDAVGFTRAEMEELTALQEIAGDDFEGLTEAQTERIQELLGGWEEFRVMAGLTREEMIDLVTYTEDSVSVVEHLSRASASSSASMDDLMAAFANGGSIAAQFGLSVETTAAIFAVFAENGTKGAEAGTALKSMLNNMMRPTEDVAAAYELLGTNMFDAMGNVRPAEELFSDIAEAFNSGNLTMEEQIRIANTLAGSHGQLLFNALTGTDNAIGDMKDTMAGQASASDVAAARMDTFKQSVESLKGSVEALMITALTPFMDDVLTPMVKQLTDVVNGFRDWTKENPEFVAKALPVLGIITALGPILLIAGKAIGAIGGLLSAVGAILGLIASPIGLVVGLIALLGAAFHTNFGGIRDTVMPIIEDLGLLFEQTVMPAIAVAVTFLTERVFPLIERVLAEIVLPALNLFIDVLGGILRFILPIAGALLNVLVGVVFPAIADVLEQFVIPAISGFIELLAGVWAEVEPALMELRDWFINTALPAIVTFIQTHVAPVIEGVFTFIKNVWEFVRPGLEQFANWFINDAMPAIVHFVNTVVRPVIEGFFNFLKGVWDIVRPFVESIVTWFTQDSGGFKDLITNGVKVVWGLLSLFFQFIKVIWDAVRPGIEQMVDWFTRDSGGFKDIMTVVLFPLIATVKILEAVLKAVWNAVQPGLNDLKNGMDSIFSWIADNVLNPIIDLINSMIGGLNGVLELSDEVFGTNWGRMGQIQKIGETPSSGIQGVDNLRNNNLAAVMGYSIGGSFASGASYIPRDMLAMLHQGERVLSPSENANGGGFSIESVVIQADTHEGGRAAAQAFIQELTEWGQHYG